MEIEALIKLLVDEAIRFKTLENKTELSLESFLDYLREKNVSVPNKKVLKLPEHLVDQEIIVHIGRLYRYAHSYLKTSLLRSQFSTDMDFAFTAILHQYGPMRKMDLIRRMVYEKSSGMEIIKRLIKAGLIEQADHPQDKRSKLLKLTPNGESEILNAYEKAGPAAQTVSLPLSKNEKNLLIGILSKLDDFHLAHYLEGKSNPIDILKDSN